MSNAEILRCVAARQEVERVVNVTCGGANADLAQMIYEVLMRLPDERLETLYTKGELKRFISGIARRQYYSTTSRYHRLLRRRPEQRRLCDND